MRVLLIEDDEQTARSIELMLKGAGFNIFTTDLGEEGVDLGKVYEYDLIILDLGLPDISGYEVLKQLRLSRVNTPVLILSANPDIEAKVKTLGYGADDYLTKPFNKDELIARITAIVRRSKGHAESVIRTGDIIVNLDAKTVEVANNRVHLTGKEYQMFELLSLRKGTTLTKEMFLNHLYGGMDEPELKIIDVFICKLRKKLAEATGGQNYIEVPFLDWILEHRAWFDLFYEHVNYFRLDDLRRMFGTVHEAGHLFGGQYLYIVADLATLRLTPEHPVSRLDLPEGFTASLERAVQIIQDAPEQGSAIWGASSKGVIYSLFLQRAGVAVDRVVDINPAKQGRYLPLSGVRVSSPQEAMDALPEGANLFVMNSNYLEEIKRMTDGRYVYHAVDSASFQ